MIELAILAALITGPDQETIGGTREADIPQRVSTTFEARCGRQNLVLSGLGAGLGPPALRLNRRTLDLPPETAAFLGGERAAYRVSAVCPDTAPAFQLIIYRATGDADGQVSYELRALDIARDGRVIDGGHENIDAEGYWFR